MPTQGSGLIKALKPIAPVPSTFKLSFMLSIVKAFSRAVDSIFFLQNLYF
jgi:hypothetical protein